MFSRITHSTGIIKHKYGSIPGPRCSASPYDAVHCIKLRHALSLDPEDVGSTGVGNGGCPTSFHENFQRRNEQGILYHTLICPMILSALHPGGTSHLHSTPFLAPFLQAKMPLQYRDFCAHMLKDLNECRIKNKFVPWACKHEKHDYFKCQYLEVRRWCGRAACLG